MATSPDEPGAIRARLERLETGLAEVRTIAESAETLATLADRDTSDIKASHAAILRSLQALHHTQVDHSRQLADHGRQLTELRTDVTVLRTDVTDIGRGLGVVRDGVATIIHLLTDREAG